MSKCLTVVALVLLVLTGAMGLRNIVAANAATLSASGLSAPAIWANGGGPIPPRNGGGPIPPRNGGGPIPPQSISSGVLANGGGPIPPRNGGGPIPPRNGGGPIPPLKGGGGGIY